MQARSKLLSGQANRERTEIHNRPAPISPIFFPFPMRPAPAPAPARWRRGGRSPVPPRLLQRSLVVASFSAATLILLILLQHHHHGPKPSNPSSASGARAFSDELTDEPPPAERDAEVGDGATCATVEKMGEEAAGARRGSPEQTSLRVREIIRRHFELQGSFR
jgi:hypothetical protein